MSTAQSQAAAMHWVVKASRVAYLQGSELLVSLIKKKIQLRNASSLYISLLLNMG